ncbi:MAG: hypothetical protein AAF702_36765 [Chloroflexota bacterium]
MAHLSLHEVSPLLERHLTELLNRQITKLADPCFGTVIDPALGIPQPQASAQLATLSIFQMLLNDSPEEALIEQASWALDGVLGLLRPTGRIDLSTVNIDSGPDTAFMVQYLCGVVELVRELASTTLSNALAPLLERLEAIIRHTVPGMLTGGFHTPNHRWVLVAALVQAAKLFPDLDVTAGVAAYLAEGFDIDPEGTFIERSVGVYDAVNTRSLLLIAANWPNETVQNEALEAVRRNLDFNIHLLHADGSAETGLSLRQDYGTRQVATGLIPSLLLFNRLRPSDQALALACHLWQHSQGANGHLTWLLYALLRAGEPPLDELPEASLPTDFTRHFPLNGIWRVRHGLLSASAFEGVTRIFGLTFGEAELTSMKISHTYFGGHCGHFLVDRLTVTEAGRGKNGEASQVLLHSAGLGKERRPGYELPLGRPVSPTKWREALPQRALRTLPPIVGELTITEIQQEGIAGFDLHYVTQDGEAGVATQIAFDFPPGGIWETDDSRLQPVAGQVIFLKRGTGEMRFHNDLIRIRSGAYAHGMWAMREAEEAPKHVRVLLTFMTPVDCHIQIWCERGGWETK